MISDRRKFSIKSLVIAYLVGAAMFALAVAVATLCLIAILDAADREEKARIETQIAKGFIVRMPDISRRSKSKLGDCRIEGERMFCESFKNGERTIMEVSK